MGFPRAGARGPLCRRFGIPEGIRKFCRAFRGSKCYGEDRKFRFVENSRCLGVLGRSPAVEPFSDSVGVREPAGVTAQMRTIATAPDEMDFEDLTHELTHDGSVESAAHLLCSQGASEEVRRKAIELDLAGLSVRLLQPTQRLCANLFGIRLPGLRDLYDELGDGLGQGIVATLQFKHH